MTCTTYSSRNSVNHQLALPQVKTTNCGLHSIRCRTAKHCNCVQNSSKKTNNLLSSKKFLKAFKENTHSDNPTIAWYFQRCSINLIVCLLVFLKQESWKYSVIYHCFQTDCLKPTLEHINLGTNINIIPVCSVTKSVSTFNPKLLI